MSKDFSDVCYEPVDCCPPSPPPECCPKPLPPVCCPRPLTPVCCPRPRPPVCCPRPLPPCCPCCPLDPRWIPFDPCNPRYKKILRLALHRGNQWNKMRCELICPNPCKRFNSLNLKLVLKSNPKNEPDKQNTVEIQKLNSQDGESVVVFPPSSLVSKYPGPVSESVEDAMTQTEIPEAKSVIISTDVDKAFDYLCQNPHLLIGILIKKVEYVQFQFELFRLKYFESRGIGCAQPEPEELLETNSTELIGSKSRSQASKVTGSISKPESGAPRRSSKRTSGRPSTQPPSITPPSIMTPSIKLPSKKSPSTKSPSAKSPSTKSPSTKSPSAKSPSTKSPSTKSPSIKSPSTKPPSIKPPSTKRPSIEPPSTKPPSIKPPSTKRPSIEPPSTKPPSTKPPSTKPPCTKRPSEKPSIAAPGRSSKVGEKVPVKSDVVVDTISQAFECNMSPWALGLLPIPPKAVLKPGGPNAIGLDCKSCDSMERLPSIDSLNTFMPKGNDVMHADRIRLQRENLMNVDRESLESVQGESTRSVQRVPRERGPSGSIENSQSQGRRPSAKSFHSSLIAETSLYMGPVPSKREQTIPKEPERTTYESDKPSSVSKKKNMNKKQEPDVRGMGIDEICEKYCTRYLRARERNPFIISSYEMMPTETHGQRNEDPMHVEQHNLQEIAPELTDDESSLKSLLKPSKNSKETVSSNSNVPTSVMLSTSDLLKASPKKSKIKLLLDKLRRKSASRANK